MADKSKPIMQNGSSKESNVLQRVLQLPVVSSALKSLQRTYASTKKTHPLMGSVFSTYERALQNACSLALWSVKPLVQKLEPQLAVANILACHGLDHLEQKIPALHEPVGKATSDLKNTVLAHLQWAVCSVVDMMDRVFGQATENDEKTKKSLKVKAENPRNSQVNQVVESSTDGKLAGSFLPNLEYSSASKSPGGCMSKMPPISTFGKVQSIAFAVSEHAFRPATQAIQFTKDQGLKLGGLAKQTATKALQVTSDVQGTANEWLGERQEEMWENTKGKGEVWKLLGSLQATCVSSISSMTNVPITAWNTARQVLHLSPHQMASEVGAKVGILHETLANFTGSVLRTIFYYVPVLVEEEDPAATAMALPEHCQEQEGAPPVSVTRKRSSAAQLQERRSSRGHYPLPFLNLDEPFQPHQSPALDAECTTPRKSAFSPYKEGSRSRRWSEGLFRPNLEATYLRAHFTGLYSAVLKKD